MAATASLIRTPFSFEPVITNGLWVGISTTYSTYTKTDFKYIITPFTYNNTGNQNYTGVYNTNVATTIEGNFKTIPEASDGTGWLALQKILQSKIKSNKLFFGVINGGVPLGTYSYNYNSTLLHADNSALRYGFYYSIEYNPNLTFNRITQVSPYSNAVIEFNTAPDLIVNDVIKVSKTNPYRNSELNTYTTIVGMLSATQAMVDKVPIGSLSTDTGRITYLKRLIKGVTMSTVDSDGFFAINGIRTATQSYDFNPLPHIRSSVEDETINYKGGRPFLTKQKVREIYTNQYDSITFLANPNVSTQRVDYIVANTYDAGFNLLNKFTFSSYMSNYATTNNNLRKWQIACGTKDLTDTGATLSNAKYIRWELITGDNTTINFYRIIVDNNSYYDNVRLGFLNTLGGWDFFNFNMKNKRKIDVNRNEFKRNLTYNYNVTNFNGTRQNLVKNISVEEEFTINTDWLNINDYKIIEDLFVSPEVYIVKDVGYNLLVSDSILSTPSPQPQIIPIVLTSKALDTMNELDDTLYQLTFTYRYAFDTVSYNR